MVELVDPRIDETVYDPATGTAGFLVAAYDYIRLANSTPDGIVEWKNWRNCSPGVCISLENP